MHKSRRTSISAPALQKYCLLDAQSGVLHPSAITESAACRVSTPQCGGAKWQQCLQSVAVTDIKWYSQFNSLLNMLRTIFICAVLAAGVFVFNRDASRLVLEPIERMLKKVKDVSENPLAMKQVGLCNRESGSRSSMP